MNALLCSTDITLDELGNPECSGGWVQQVYTLPFEISQLTPELVLGAFTGGFVMFATPYVAAVGIKQIISFLK